MERTAVQIMQTIKILKKDINAKEFCELHGVSLSKYSRFPSKKFMKELEMFDYMKQFYEYKNGIYNRRI